MSDPVILEEVSEHILLLTLNRPEAANALSSRMIDAIQDTVQDIKERSNVRVVIITGSGDKAFCAGADLRERDGMSDEEVIRTVEKIGDSIQLIEEIPVPTIAVLNGVALGGGLELALACDLRMMSTSTKVGLTETSLAIIPGAGGTQRLPRLIGLGKAKELIFTAKPVDAIQALHMSLVEYIYDPQLLYEEAKDLAQSIARNAPVALQEAKRSIQYGFETDMATGLRIERQCYQKTIPTKDRIEGLLAFKEKRQPLYKGN